MIIALGVAGVLLIAALLGALVRLVVGPSPMDRALAVDVITAASIGLLVVIMAGTGSGDLVPVLVALGLVGFVGSTTIARFSNRAAQRASRQLNDDQVRLLLVADERRRWDGTPIAGEGEEDR